MKIYVLIAVLLAACEAQTQSQELKFFTVELPPDGQTPSSIHFKCSQDYDKGECLKDAVALRKALAPYPLQLLGEWSYYLVIPGDWKALARSHGGPSVSPAFSLLLGRATVLDRSVLSGSADRNLELEKWSGIPMGPEFVAVALTHELGHAICLEKNERKANEYGRRLREGKALDCSQKPGRMSTAVAQNPP